MNYKVKLGQNGRVVIPADCRKQLNMHEGDELVLAIDEQGVELRLSTLKHSVQKAQQIVKKYQVKTKKANQSDSLVDQLFAMRREENNKPGTKSD